MKDHHFISGFCQKYGYPVQAGNALIACAEAIDFHKTAKEKQEILS